MTNILNILFLGDIAGRPGRRAVAQYLNVENIRRENYDFIIANVENASHGFGLTEKNYHDLADCGINAMTSGNHIWDKKEIFSYMETADRLIRPLNFHYALQGKGSRIFELHSGIFVGVINLQGTVFMPSINPPWQIMKEEILKMQSITPIVIIDFHAEATAEKIACGYMADKLSVSALIGTHTHIQTADERILDAGCAYITDVGFCGAYESVIGMGIEDSIKRFETGLPIKFDVAESQQVQINAVAVKLDAKTGSALEIKRIYEIFNLERGN